MPSSVRKKPHSKGKSEAFRDSVSAESGANKCWVEALFWQLPWTVAAICDLSSGAKVLYAKLNFDAWRSNCCWVGTRSLAKTLRVDRETIRGWLRELEIFGLIKVVHERACSSYYLYPRYRVGGFVSLLIETMKRRDVGWAYKLVMCSLSYRIAGHDWTWTMQKAFAVDLGLSVRTIQRVLADMKANAEIQIRLRRRNRKHGNKYALTCGAVLRGRVFGANSHTTKYPHLYKKWYAKIYFKRLRRKFPPGDLSASGSGGGFEAKAVFDQLVGYRINEKVARPMAFEQHHPFESVVQAENNAQILRAAVFKRSEDARLPRPKFNVAGYVINALNGARREGKAVGTTKLYRKTGKLYLLIKQAKAGRGRNKPPSPEVIADRVRQQKRALGVGT